jgi:leucyl/phenylalanyl-tRNA---protein transferase
VITQEHLIDYVEFPDPSTESDEEGIVAIGGEMNAPFLISAYRQGIFPWFNPEDPIVWWSPDPRCILQFEDLHVSKTLKQLIRSKKYQVKCDTNFEQVMLNCQKIPRKHEEGTWISEDILEAYIDLHDMGLAHSFEVYNSNDELVGGLYGVSMGEMFFGESMFAFESNTSKIAFVYMTYFLNYLGFDLIDCQITNPHLTSLGCSEMPRDKFLKINKKSMTKDSLIGTWTDKLNLFGKDFDI